jgi:hypothetical protein
MSNVVTARVGGSCSEVDSEEPDVEGVGEEEAGNQVHADGGHSEHRDRGAWTAFLSNR